jgi:hypothetical protein
MLKIISLLLLSLIAFESQAYVITTYKTTTMKNDLPTRIIVAGGGDDLGTMFQQVAIARAHKFLEQSAEYQIVFISALEKGINNKEFLKQSGFNILDEKKSTFDGEALINVLVKFNKIASIDIFSHSSAQYGLHLDSKIHRLTTNTKGLENLKGHFLKDAYAQLHGCNSGFTLAPFLANIWEIPVAGSLTSTNFQRLHSDGNYYLTEEGFSPNSDWAAKSKCDGGVCLRLKPDNHPYVGFWGDYGDGGLPFYKFFCPKNTTEVCNRVMAKSLLNFSGLHSITSASSLSEYKKVVIDFLCPISAKSDLRNECAENLETSLVTGDETYNPFSRTLIECNFESCQAEIICKSVIFIGPKKPGTCNLINHFEGKPTTLVREYKAYLNGFLSLNK